MHCDDETALLLASLALQAEYGDYQAEVHHQFNLSETLFLLLNEGMDGAATHASQFYLGLEAELMCCWQFLLWSSFLLV